MLLEEEKDERCRQEAEAVLAKLNRDSAMDSARKLLGDNQIRHAELACEVGMLRLYLLAQRDSVATSITALRGDFTVTSHQLHSSFTPTSHDLHIASQSLSR